VAVGALRLLSPQPVVYFPTTSNTAGWGNLIFVSRVLPLREVSGSGLTWGLGRAAFGWGCEPKGVHVPRRWHTVRKDAMANSGGALAALLTRPRVSGQGAHKGDT